MLLTKSKNCKNLFNLLPNPQMTTVITHNVLSFDERCEQNYTNNRENFVNYLIEECDYPMTIAQEVDDWREERLKAEYAIYLTIQPTIKEIQQRAFEKYAQDYPDEAREMLLELNNR